MKDPIILWPKVTPAEVWEDCQKWVADKGGLGEENPGQLMAAAGADPGCCSCPGCHEHHWAYGTIHKCPACGFVYPTDWWRMFAWGCAAGRRDAKEELTPVEQHCRDYDEKRRGHPYWEYGYKHRFEEPWAERKHIDWKTEIGVCYVAGGEFIPVTDYFEKCGKPEN